MCETPTYYSVNIKRVFIGELQANMDIITSLTKQSWVFIRLTGLGLGLGLELGQGLGLWLGLEQELEVRAQDLNLVQQ